MSRRPCIYIAGPMSGLPECNYPAFMAAEEKLRADGVTCEIINPARNFNGTKGLPYPVYIRRSIQQVLEATDLYVLRGWSKSSGAQLEVQMARLLGLMVIFEEGAIDG